MILVTGATGFVGHAFCDRLAVDGLEFRAACRDPTHCTLPATWAQTQGILSPGYDWTEALAAVDCVVHCAARAHVMRDRAVDPQTDFHVVNVEGTSHLARQAAAMGVRRFIFLSSIKVNGENTAPGRPFHADQVPEPRDEYARSKAEAEWALRSLAAETGMEIVVIRSPLAYGPGVKGNFELMMRWVWYGIPLPLGGVHNRRSLVGIDNLVDLMVLCIDHPAAGHQTFLVADGEDLSTTDLLQRLAVALGRPSHLLPFPEGFLNLAARLLGREDLANRLLGSLQADISKTRERLGWQPRVTVDEGLISATTAWLKTHTNSFRHASTGKKL